MADIAGIAADKPEDPLMRGIADAVLQFDINRETFLASGDAEALHQLRIALRRLRCAFSIIGWKGESERVIALSADARRIGDATGVARKCDVLLTRIGEEFPAGPARDSVAGLVGALQALRAQGVAEASVSLEGPAAELLRNVREFMNAEGGSAKPRKVVRRLRRKVLRRGRNFRRMSDDDRHRLRIAIKKLRYGAEFFEKELVGKRYGKFMKRMGRLQDLLGAHNDFAEADALLAGLPGTETPELASAKAQVTNALRKRDADAVRHLSPAWKKFRRAKPF